MANALLTETVEQTSPSAARAIAVPNAFRTPPALGTAILASMGRAYAVALEAVAPARTKYAFLAHVLAAVVPMSCAIKTMGFQNVVKGFTRMVPLHGIHRTCQQVEHSNL